MQARIGLKVLALAAAFLLFVFLAPTPASAQEKILSCTHVSTEDFPTLHEPEIHITLDEINRRAKSDYLEHDDGNFHPANFTPTRVMWVGGPGNYGGRPTSPISYNLSRTTGALTINDTHHFQCEVAQQKF
jgi:hypothetical protein